MNLNRYLDIAPEVKKALDEGRPVVALESTIISHGMPYPQNVETARAWPRPAAAIWLSSSPRAWTARRPSPRR